MRWIVLFIISLTLWISCSPDKKSLNIDFPESKDIIWTYDIIRYYDSQSEKIGTVDVVSLGKESFQNRTGVLNLENRIAIDSLQSTSQPVQFISSYFDVSGSGIAVYADDFFRLYDHTLNYTILDTITTDAGNSSFKEFRLYKPKWKNNYQFGSSPDNPSRIHESQSFAISFLHRDSLITGTINAMSTTVFDGYDFISTPVGDSIFTYRMLITTYLDFDLSKNGTPIPPFRTTIEYYTWFHRKNGIVMKDRKPIEIYIPSIPSRWPIIVVKGIKWVLTGSNQLSFN